MDPLEPSAQTQPVVVEAGLPCSSHEYRISSLERRMTSVEHLHQALSKLSTTVEVLNDRVRLLLWLSGIVTGGILLSVIGALAYVLTGIK